MYICLGLTTPGVIRSCLVPCNFQKGLCRTLLKFILQGQKPSTALLSDEARKIQCLGQIGEATLGENSSSHKVTLPVIIDVSGFQFSAQSFRDAGKLIYRSLVNWYQIPVAQLQKPISIASFSGEVLPEVNCFTMALLILQVGSIHKEQILFYVLQRSICDSCQITRWGEHCHFHYLPVIGHSHLCL